MAKENPPDWDPQSAEVLNDQVAAYDHLRANCPVAHSDLRGWSIFRYRDVEQILHDPETFSSAVSAHPAIPAGMDPPQHTVFRRIIDHYFTPERLTPLEPVCRDLASGLLAPLVAAGQAEIMQDLAVPYAVESQCAFLGWPRDVATFLANWTQRNYEATLTRDRLAMAVIAAEFQSFIDDMLEKSQAAALDPTRNIMASLRREEVEGQTLTNEQIAGILRTWTVGEIGSIASAVGIVVHFLATHPEIQAQLRGNSELLVPAVDEILRIHGPLVSSRRITTRAVEIGGRHIAAGERLSLNWVSANRDAEVFDNPLEFRLPREPSGGLLYGAGIHVCPGAPLARLELRVVLEELFSATSHIKLNPAATITNAVFPDCGYAMVPVLFK